ncbi:MAG TPA: ATP-grasp domain-containing protein [Pyrinomonadaceae bacterium]|nr:ATP-grasp domain-containing protein [Pyrinomonadaceae bacterium]
MILLCGIPTETPMALVSDALDSNGTRYVVLNQRKFASMKMSLDIQAGKPTGRLQLNGDSYSVDEFTGVFSRLMDYHHLPELQDAPADSPELKFCGNLFDTLTRWAEISPARVVNRIAPMGSNFSKPFQAQLIKRYGFEVPETLITNDPELVRAFRARHGRIIYKSISGVRSIVQTLTDEDMMRIDNIRWCPTQFQAFVEGTNVRVHTVGDKVFATAISTEATDYRYAHRQSGDHAELRPVELSDDLAEMCVKLAAGLGLAFAGIDLKITPEKDAYCFEVNPSPAFSYYESQTGQPISRAVAEYLSGN